MTPTLLATVLLVAAPTLVAAAPVPTALGALAPAVAGAPGADPCDGVALLPEDPACDGPLCSVRERTAVVCQLRDAMKARYVFFPVKGKLLDSGRGPFDPAAHLEACVTTERAIAREEDPLRFYDRVRACTGAFEDGHLLLGAPVRLPVVALGVALRLVDGRVHVAAVEPRLVAQVAAAGGAPDLAAVLVPGAEVVELDGRPVAAALGELERLVAGSSPGARRERAVDALTRRDFAFPARPTAALTLVVDGARRVVELPWWISPDARGHLMASAYLARTPLATTDLLDWRTDRDAATQGALRSDPIVPPAAAAALRQYRDDQDRLAARLGEVQGERGRFCYAQLLTFHTEKLTGEGGPAPYAEVLGRFVRACGEKRLDLVIDLRQNGGGYLSHSTALATAVTPPGQAAPGGALLLRASTQNQLVYQQRMVGSGPGADDDPFAPRRIVEALGTARRAGAAYSPALLDGPLRPSPATGGFQGRVVALTSPACMSACDRLAGLLKASGRAVLVGGPTEGAGGSQQEAKNLGARWTDSQGLLSLSIPNAAMGVLPGAGAPVDSAPETFFARLALENRPVLPDVAYGGTLRDLTGHNAGWLERAEDALFGAGGVAAR